MKRAALFVLAGVGYFAYWSIAKAGFEVSATQSTWPHVLGFSAIILMLALAVPQFADLVGGRVTYRASLVVAAGAALSSAANIFEDGFKIDEAFFAFVAGTAVTVLGLLALTLAVAAREGKRWFALVPAGTTAGLLLFVPAGGPLLLAAWLLAAALALAAVGKPAEVTLG